MSRYRSVLDLPQDKRDSFNKQLEIIHSAYHNKVISVKERNTRISNLMTTYSLPPVILSEQPPKKTRDSTQTHTAVYTEMQEINAPGSTSQPYDLFEKELRNLMGTSVLYVEKVNDKIFVAASGIDCKRKNTSTKANCFLFYESPVREDDFLNNFYKSINQKLDSLGLEISEEDSKKLENILRNTSAIKPEMMKPLYEDKILLKSKGFFPEYSAPNPLIGSLLTESIKSNNFKSAAYNINRRDLTGLNPDIAFSSGGDDKITPTQKTETAIQKLKTPEPKYTHPVQKDSSIWSIFKRKK